MRPEIRLWLSRYTSTRTTGASGVLWKAQAMGMIFPVITSSGFGFKMRKVSPSAANKGAMVLETQCNHQKNGKPIKKPVSHTLLLTGQRVHFDEFRWRNTDCFTKANVFSCLHNYYRH